MNRLIAFALTVFLFTAVPATAGPDKVAFQQYQNYTHYLTVDSPDIKEVRDIYANAEAVKLAKVGQSLPSGCVLVLVHFKARMNDRGELVKDPNGRLVKGDLDRIGVMEKRAGWGAEYPDEIRNGEWEYALFRPDGTRNEQANIKECFECHKPNSGKDFGFTFDKLPATAAR
jgi:hypothetical protein